MTDIRSVHRAAMETADRAREASREGRGMEAVSLFRQACGLESQAAMALVDSLNEEPTRSVLFRSAATLAAQGGLPSHAAYMVARGLEGHPPSPIRDELRDILRSVQFEDSLGESHDAVSAKEDRLELFLEARTLLDAALNGLQRTLADTKLTAGRLTVSSIRHIREATIGALRRLTPQARFLLDLCGLREGSDLDWISVLRAPSPVSASPDDWQFVANFVLSERGDSLLNGCSFIGSTQELVGRGGDSNETAEALVRVGVGGVGAWPVYALDGKRNLSPACAIILLASDPAIFRDGLAQALLRHSISLIELALVIGQRDEILSERSGTGLPDSPH